MNAPNNEPKVLVEYIGDKERKTDNVTDTGLVWHGKGDRQLVPVSRWAQLRRHAAVWREVPQTAQGAGVALSPAASSIVTQVPPTVTQVAPPAGTQPVTEANATPVPIAVAPGAVVMPTAEQMVDMDRDALFQLAVAKGLEPHKQLGKPNLLKLLGA
jgi:hypothetical protein